MLETALEEVRNLFLRYLLKYLLTDEDVIERRDLLFAEEFPHFQLIRIFLFLLSLDRRYNSRNIELITEPANRLLSQRVTKITLHQRLVVAEQFP